MTDWEHWVMYSLRGWGGLQAKLDIAGAGGWELVAVTRGLWVTTAYMKREIDYGLDED